MRNWLLDPDNPKWHLLNWNLGEGENRDKTLILRGKYSESPTRPWWPSDQAITAPRMQTNQKLLAEIVFVNLCSHTH